MWYYPYDLCDTLQQEYPAWPCVVPREPEDTSGNVSLAMIAILIAIDSDMTDQQMRYHSLDQY